MILEAWEYFSGVLLEVLSMDYTFLESHAPVLPVIRQALLAAGWALLLGNLIFQALRGMVSGLGFEGEDPRLLFSRTFVFSFLLFASPQICTHCLNMTSAVIGILNVPNTVSISLLEASAFEGLPCAWLIAVICGVVVMYQSFKLIFALVERYVVLGVLTLCAPLAFGVGGSKNTADIFQGWCRMLGSMCLLMVLNVIFVKILLSVLATAPSGVEALLWVVLVVSIVKTARKADDILTRMGLNPAISTHDGKGIAAILLYTAARNAVTQAMGGPGRRTNHPGPTGQGGSRHRQSNQRSGSRNPGSHSSSHSSRENRQGTEGFHSESFRACASNTVSDKRGSPGREAEMQSASAQFLEKQSGTTGSAETRKVQETASRPGVSRSTRFTRVDPERRVKSARRHEMLHRNLETSRTVSQKSASATVGAEMRREQRNQVTELRSSQRGTRQETPVYGRTERVATGSSAAAPGQVIRPPSGSVPQEVRRDSQRIPQEKAGRLAPPARAGTAPMVSIAADRTHTTHAVTGAVSSQTSTGAAPKEAGRSSKQFAHESETKTVLPARAGTVPMVSITADKTHTTHTVTGTANNQTTPKMTPQTGGRSSQQITHESVTKTVSPGRAGTVPPAPVTAEKKVSIEKAPSAMPAHPSATRQISPARQEAERFLRGKPSSDESRRMTGRAGTAGKSLTTERTKPPSAPIPPKDSRSTGKPQEKTRKTGGKARGG